MQIAFDKASHSKFKIFLLGILDFSLYSKNVFNNAFRNNIWYKSGYEWLVNRLEMAY